MTDCDEEVKRLVLHLLRDEDWGWKGEPPEHFATCPDVTVAEASSYGEMWFDTGVEATQIDAVLVCPHRPPTEWEWADLGELPEILRRLDDHLRP